MSGIEEFTGNDGNGHIDDDFSILTELAGRMGELEVSDNEGSEKNISETLSPSFIKEFHIDIDKDNLDSIRSKIIDNVTFRNLESLDDNVASDLGIDLADIGKSLIAKLSVNDLQYLTDDVLSRLKIDMSREELGVKALESFSRPTDLYGVPPCAKESFGISDSDLANALVQNYYLRNGYSMEMSADEFGSVVDESQGTFLLYMRHHLIENLDDFARGFKENINPYLNDERSEVFGLGYQAPRFNYDYSIDEYKIKCLTDRCIPRKVNELTRIAETLSTADSGRRIQNRVDAVALEGLIFKDHSFIHEEEPGVHIIMRAIEAYYDACKNDDVDGQINCREELKKLEDQFGYGFYGSVVGLKENGEYATPEEIIARYDGKCREYFERGYVAKDEACIDVVRRLVKNTDSLSMDVPLTGLEDLDEALKSIKPVFNEYIGETRVQVEDLAEAFSVMNKVLKDQQGELGIKPSIISTIRYLERIAKSALDGVEKKKKKELVFDPTFKEIVRFSQLTASVGYDEDKFEAFYTGMQQQISRAYTKDDDIEIKNGYAFLQQHILRNLRDLSSYYGSKRTTAKYKEGIMGQDTLAWSLIKIVDEV